MGMIRRRAASTGIKTKIGNPTFRAAGTTAYITNKVPSKQRSTSPTTSRPGTTKLYGRRQDEMFLGEVERIAI